MPLKKGMSEATLHKNIATLMNDIGNSPHVKSRKQAIAIAYSKQRESKYSKGAIDKAIAMKK
jgi:hypothetical protein